MGFFHLAIENVLEKFASLLDLSLNYLQHLLITGQTFDPKLGLVTLNFFTGTLPTRRSSGDRFLCQEAY